MIKIEEDVAKVGAIYNALAYYCKQLKLFKMTDNIYITDNICNKHIFHTRTGFIQALFFANYKTRYY